MFFFFPFFAGRRMNIPTSGGCRFGLGDRFSQIKPSLVIILIMSKLTNIMCFIDFLEGESKFLDHLHIFLRYLLVLRAKYHLFLDTMLYDCQLL